MYLWVGMDVGYFLNTPRYIFLRKKWLKQRKINISKTPHVSPSRVKGGNPDSEKTSGMVHQLSRCPRIGGIPFSILDLVRSSFAPHGNRASLRFQFESRPHAVHCFEF